jgi:hypothetical protein
MRRHQRAVTVRCTGSNSFSLVDSIGVDRVALEVVLIQIERG